MTQAREHWGSKLGFILAAIGSAIGLGVLWKFPYTIGENGGGIFLILYAVSVAIIGIPVFIAELLLGRATQKASVGAFHTLCKGQQLWKVGGWFGVLSSFLIMSFYSVIAGWGVSYILMSLCNFFVGKSPQEISQAFNTLSTSGSVTVLWHFLFTLLTMSIVFSGVRKGIEKYSKLMTRALFVILLVLLVYSFTLEGFWEAFRFIFYPNLSKVKITSALEALGLAFFTLSLGQGIMISYGSYMKKEESLWQMSVIVAASVIVVAILAALTVFPVVFTFGFKSEAGLGLIFETLPALFNRLPGTTLVATIFFTLFVFCALTSSVAFIEVVAANLMELYGFERKPAVALVALGCFLFGIPSALAYSGGFFDGWSGIYGMNFLDTINNLVSTWIIPVGGLITSIFVGWVVDEDTLRKEFIMTNSDRYIYSVWKAFVKYLIPVIILIIILQDSEIIQIQKIIKL